MLFLKENVWSLIRIFRRDASNEEKICNGDVENCPNINPGPPTENIKPFRANCLVVVIMIHITGIFILFL